MYSTYAALPPNIGELPVKSRQAAFLTGCTVVGMLYVAYLIGEVATVLEDLRESDPDKAATLKSVDDYMTYHRLSGGLRARVRHHYIFLHNRKNTRGCALLGAG